MNRASLAAMVALAGLLTLRAPLSAAEQYVEGKDYFPIVPAQQTSVGPGKIEVAEMFSYGCPFCAQYNPLIEQFEKALPANAQLVLVPASFSRAEDWPMFQRATCTAQALHIVEKTHQAMFDAVWKTGELAVVDATTHQLKNPLPTIEDAARFYHRVAGVPVDKFIQTSKSFSVDMQMRKDDGLLLASHVDSTPSLVVNGRYRVPITQNGGVQRMLLVARSLVDRESATQARNEPAPKAKGELASKAKSEPASKAKK